MVATAEIPVTAPEQGAAPLVETGGPDGASAGMAVRARRLSHMSLALIVLAVIAFVAALYFARAFLVPLLIGILGSYALRPVVDFLQRIHIHRAIGAALVMVVLIGGVSWIGITLSDQATMMMEKLPSAARKLRQNLSYTRSTTVPSALQNVQEAASELQGAATDAAQKPGTPISAPKPVAHTTPAVAPDSPSWLGNYALAQSALLISLAAQTPIVLLLAYFLLASGDHFRRKLVRLVGPSLSRKKDALRMLEEIDTQVQRYLLVTLVSNVLVAVSTWLALAALGMEQAGIWGVFAGVMHFVPYLGPVAVAIAVGVAAFVQFETVWHALAAAGTTLLISGMVGMVFMPWLQSRFARLNAAVLFIALLFFGWLWGIAGLLLGAPLLAIAKVICDRVDSLKPAGELLGR